jgi:hypothetical protein
VVRREGENPRDHVGCRDKTQDWPEHWDHEDVRDRAGCRHRERAQGRTPSRERDGSESRETEDARNRSASQARSAKRDDPRDRREPREREDTRGRAAYRDEDARDRSESGESEEDERGRSGSRQREDDDRERTAGAEREVARRRSVAREDVPDQAAASEIVVPEGAVAPKAPADRPGPLGPIFPPRPAAEVEVAPVAPAPAVIVPPAAFTAQAVAALEGVIPATATELRNALDLLLRYAAHLPIDPIDEVPVRPTMKGERKPFGIAAEAGGDV